MPRDPFAAPEASFNIDLTSSDQPSSALAPDSFYESLAATLTPDEADFLSSLPPDLDLDDPVFATHPVFQSITGKLQAASAPQGPVQAPTWAPAPFEPVPLPSAPPDPRIPTGGALDAVKALGLDSHEAFLPENPANRRAPLDPGGLMGLIENVGGLTGSPAGKFVGSMWDQPGHLPAALTAAGQEFTARAGEFLEPLTREEREARRTSAGAETESRFGPQPAALKFALDTVTDPANYIGGSPVDMVTSLPKLATSVAGLALHPAVLKKIAAVFPNFAAVLGETVMGGGKLASLGSLTRPQPASVLSNVDSLQAFKDLRGEGKAGAMSKAYKEAARLSPDVVPGTHIARGEALGASPADIVAFYVKQHGDKAEHVLPGARDFVRHLQEEGLPIHAGLWHDVMDGTPVGYTRVQSHFVPDAQVAALRQGEKAAQRSAAYRGPRGTVTVDGREVAVTLEPHAAKRGDVLVTVDMDALDKGWQRDTGFYVGPGGAGAIRGRLERFDAFLRANGTMEASEVTVGPTGRVSFSDGRHRLAYLRDKGVTQVPVAMDKASLKNAQKHGILATESRVVRPAPPTLLGPTGQPVSSASASGLVDPSGRPATAAGPRIIYTPAQLSEGHLNLAPAGQNAQGDVRLSTRIPWAVKAEAPTVREPLTTDLSTVLEAGPAVVGKLAKEMRSHTLLTAKEAELPDAEMLERLVEKMKDNLLWLWDRDEVQAVAPVTREWYVGAQVRAYEDAPLIGVTPEQVAASIAALSPKKDWHQNAELARRFGYTWRDLTDVNAPFSREVFNHYAASAIEGRRGSVAWTTMTEAEQAQDLVKAQKQLVRDRARYVDVHFKDLPKDGRAKMIRAYAEVAFPTEFNLIRPTGEYGPVATNAATKLKSGRVKPGGPAKLGWGLSQSTLIKALSALEDGRIVNLSDVVGDAHKVRSFYNNIIDPWWPGAVTIDTHAIAAAHLMPLSLEDREVTYAMGGLGDAMTGITGGNPIYAEAYNRAAKAREVLPREMQSVTWEALRGMFTPAQKSDKDFTAHIRALWDNYRKQGGDLDALREEILAFARKDSDGKIKPPNWTTTDDE